MIVYNVIYPYVCTSRSPWLGPEEAEQEQEDGEEAGGLI